ncbi:bifunctional diguanylate cyclase/phosphodiesterase [Halomonas sp. ANAO-440]|uniref:putative bifunctional diguanylate cyclase/phosphodiesterase n=1 Tax=Halomonas sp. ANAO-440 TaxID=2861360 RepID=UPI001CAA6256|nr:bifunctional diguanylate cyclase/phosphodiesterase [Halomonas sp. ANAO-440]MBZ0331664.1 bifunctional diguanylate cyclase/phosphodiesterase [Halomonas sp. ANAO-440]
MSLTGLLSIVRRYALAGMLAGLSSTAAGSVEGAALVPASSWAVLAIVALVGLALAAACGAWWGRRVGSRRAAHSPADKVKLANDSDGRDYLPCGVATDITECHAIQESNYRLTFYDPLTGLPNRRLMLDRLEMVVKGSRRTDRYAALMFIDLDNFKLVNDTQGLSQGDHLLRHVADHLSRAVRESDTLARLGGDEFVLLIHDLDPDQEQAAHAAELVAEKLLARIQEAQQDQEQALTLPITGSIGVTLFADGETSVESAMQQADMALQQAKGAGGNTLRFFNSAMQATVMARVQLEADLHLALARDEFRLHYQVQVDSLSRVTGVEALIRWEHPQRGMVSPGMFIPLAEKNRMILPIGYWVLETACRQLVVWAQEPERESLSIAVNVSSVQFHQPDFVVRVQQILKETAANPCRLTLEVTESLLMDDHQRVREIMLRLNQIGIRFALDDFGTGYSSLNYLKRLPLDELKIDQAFVDGVLDDPVDAAIVQATITLAASLGLDVTAEGVETEAQHQWLLANGCKAFQGYLFGRPQPVAELQVGQVSCTHGT